MSTKTVFATILGRPNVGKSTLLNALIGEKISIVSPKPQTTRNRITGILTKDDVQFVFLDTPGFIKGRNGLGKFMEQAVASTVAETETAIFVAEPRMPGEREREMLKSLQENGASVILVLNKTDRIEKEKLLPVIAAFGKECDFQAVIPLSAKTGDGIDILLAELAKKAEESPFFFDEDQMTDQSEAIFACEIVREKMLWLLGAEVPHGVALSCDIYQEEAGIINIELTIYCSKASHKGIIIGKSGAMLKRISTEAREDLEKHLGKKVYLRCYVRVKRDWENNKGMLDSLGFSNS